MNLDPDVLRSKSRSTFTRWMAYAAADAAVDDYRSQEATAEMERIARGSG